MTPKSRSLGTAETMAKAEQTLTTTKPHFRGYVKSATYDNRVIRFCEQTEQPDWLCLEFIDQLEREARHE